MRPAVYLLFANHFRYQQRFACAARQVDQLIMPFKSRAQRRKFAELLVKGKIKPETYEEWNRETGGKKLPERVRHKKKKTGKRRKRR